MYVLSTYVHVTVGSCGNQAFPEIPISNVWAFQDTKERLPVLKSNRLNFDKARVIAKYSFEEKPTTLLGVRGGSHAR